MLLGATLPQQQRANSPTWRRAHDPRSLGLNDAAELVAFIRLVGFTHSARILRWGFTKRTYVTRLLDHPPIQPLADRYERAWVERLTVDDGLAFLRTMIESGRWKGRPPFFVMQSLRSLRKRGYTVPEIAEQLGLSAGRLYQWFNPPRHYAQVAEERKAVALAL